MFAQDGAGGKCYLIDWRTHSQLNLDTPNQSDVDFYQRTGRYIFFLPFFVNVQLLTCAFKAPCRFYRGTFDIDL